MSEPAKVAAKPRAVKAVEPTATPPAEPVLSAGQLRAYRSRKIGIRFLIFVGLPTVIACVYYLAIATSLYDARAVVAVQSTSPIADAAASKTAQTTHQRDAHLLAARAEAREVRAALGAKDLVEVDATVDTTSSAVTVRVRAHSSARAVTLARDIVTRLTTWVEEQSQRARQERIAPAERDVADAKAHLAKLERIAAGAPQDGTSNLTEDLDTARLELEAATDGLKQARLEASHAQIYLVTVDAPRAEADRAWPRPLWNITTVMVCAIVLVSVLSLLGAAVREHANF